nr:hypothetical protein [Echinothamnion sp.]
MITKQMYIAMKKYDLIYVYQLQKYIINCSEAKIVLMDKILCNLKLYYNNCTNIQLLIKNINKLDVLQSLFITQSPLYSSFIEQIKQNLIYISIKPIWTSKIIKSLANFTGTIKLDFLCNNDKYVNNRSFLTKAMIKKLGCYNYINKSISKWFYNNVYLNLSKIYSSQYVEYITKSKNNESKLNKQNSESLFILLNRIIINDLSWYKLNCFRKNYSSFAIANNEFIIISNRNKMINLLKIFSISLKHLLYRKTYKQFNKLNLFNNKNQLLNKIKSLYINYYFSIPSFISLNFIESCNEIVNYFTGLIIHKKLNVYYYLYKLQPINQLLNKFIYFCNIYALYQ